MSKQTFDINKLRVASPCSVPWETMTGDERVRRCHSCELNIYNIAEMTEREVENLIANREERLCIRLYKRVDGTVLTKDCPVGLRAYQKRVARLAGAALTAILGLFSVSYGQKKDNKTPDVSKFEAVTTVNQSGQSFLTGTVYDPGGAVIPGANIKLYKKDNKKKSIKITTDENGTFERDSLPAGIYILEIKAFGFKEYKIYIEIIDGKKLQLNMTLDVNGDSVTVGTFGEPPLIDINSSSIQTTITKKMIEKQP